MRTLLTLALAFAALLSCDSPSGRDAGSPPKAGGTAGGSMSGGVAGGSTGGGAGGSGGGRVTGGGSAGGGSSGGSPIDAGLELDAGTVPVVCGTSLCEGPTPTCCATTSSGMLALSCESECPDAGAAWTCDDPTDCDSDAGLPFCCANLALGPGTFALCPPLSLSSRCAATCPTTVGPTCPSTGTVRVCGRGADCVTGEKCCAFGQSVQFCVDTRLSCTAIP